MSAPNRYAKEAEYLKFGFLSVRAKETIKKALENKKLSSDDMEVLDKANNFLRSISEGAQIVTTGKYYGHSPRESMTALDFAMNPIEQLQAMLTNKELSEYFNQLAETVEKIQEDPSKITEYDKENLEVAASFFEIMCQSLITAMSEKKRSVNDFFDINKLLSYS